MHVYTDLDIGLQLWHVAKIFQKCNYTSLRNIGSQIYMLALTRFTNPVTLPGIPGA